MIAPNNMKLMKDSSPNKREKQKSILIDNL